MHTHIVHVIIEMVFFMKVLIIIPTYNEEKNILNTINQVKEYKKIKLDYIVINDGSKDSTEQVLIENQIKHITLINNSGIGAAVQTGYLYAFKHNYDIAVQFDGDGQHDINYVDKLVNCIEKEGFNMAIGSRFVGNESEFKSSPTRRIGIIILSSILQMITGHTIKDMTSGYRAVDKNLIKLFSHNYDFEYPEPITNLVAIKNKYTVKEIAVKMYERKFGKSSINLYKSIYYMMSVCLKMIILGIGRNQK